MDIDKFNLLNKHHQITHTWQFGVYIAERADQMFTFELYHIYNFYVEIRYLPGKYCVEEVRSFTTGKHLVPYLDDIEVSKLLSTL